MSRRWFGVATAAGVHFLCRTLASAGVGSGLTYQGRLKQDGVPVSGTARMARPSRIKALVERMCVEKEGVKL